MFSRQIRSLALAAPLIVGVALPVLAQQATQPAPPPATVVGVDTVRKEQLSQTVPVIGRFVATRTGVIAARVAGPVASFDVEVGNRIEAGGRIARLVDDAFVAERNRYAADAATASAKIATQRSRLRLVQQELDRLIQLRTSPAFSQAKLDDKEREAATAKSELSEAEAALKAAEANLQLASIALRNTEIKAPYGGIVTLRQTEAGAYVRPGDPVMTLLDDKNLEIEADVPAIRVGGLTPNRLLAAKTDENKDLAVAVRAVIPDENPRTRTRRVRFTVQPSQESMAFAANESVTVMVPAGATRDVVTVHKDAVLNRQGATLVVVNEDGKSTFRPVVLGEALGPRFEVKNGLAVGDVVVIRGNERLRPGQPITAGAMKPAG